MRAQSSEFVPFSLGLEKFYQNINKNPIDKSSVEDENSLFLCPPKFHLLLFSSYLCMNCGRKGCKLWRLTHMPKNHQILKCFQCIPNYRIRTLAKDGTFLGEDGQRTYIINNMIPAVPKFESFDSSIINYWGYIDLPEKNLRWWQNLRS